LNTTACFGLCFPLYVLAVFSFDARLHADEEDCTLAESTYVFSRFALLRGACCRHRSITSRVCVFDRSSPGHMYSIENYGICHTLLVFCVKQFWVRLPQRACYPTFHTFFFLPSESLNVRVSVAPAVWLPLAFIRVNISRRMLTGGMYAQVH